MFRLDGKIAFVTGAGSGIGADIAELFVRESAKVYLGDRDFSGVQDVARRLGSADMAMQVDVTSEVDCAKAAEHILQNDGRLDILINNAGIGAVGTMLEAEGEDIDRLYAVNVRGIFNVTKVFLPSMVERGSGNIINMASVGGVVGIRDRLAYCTSKFAVVGLTKCMALDHAAQGIRVNCICPGRVETPFVTARIQEYGDPDLARKEMSATQLSGRMISPDEVAAAALYLASDQSAMVTGTAFLIDGGWTAGK